MPSAFSATKQAQDGPRFDEYAATAWPSPSRRCSGPTASGAKVSRADQPPAYVRRMQVNLLISQRRPQGRRLELLTDAPLEPRPLAAPAKVEM